MREKWVKLHTGGPHEISRLVDFQAIGTFWFWMNATQIIVPDCSNPDGNPSLLCRVDARKSLLWKDVACILALNTAEPSEAHSEASWLLTSTFYLNARLMLVSLKDSYFDTQILLCSLENVNISPGRCADIDHFGHFCSLVLTRLRVSKTSSFPCLCQHQQTVSDRLSECFDHCRAFLVSS